MSAANPFKVLLVDDDGSVLAGLQNVLRRERGRWSVRTAEGAERALEEMARDPADVVVSDVRMPVVDGVELLGRILGGWPATARVLLSGYSDFRSITRAGTVAHRYLLKPCDGETLRSVLADIEEIQALIPDPGLRALLGGLRSLPASPATLPALGALPPDPAERSRAIFRVAGSDVALAVRILQLVSSPSFGSPRPVEGLRAALALLGEGVVREIASLLEPLSSTAELPGALEALQRLERHARSAASMARILARDDADADVAATAALLHDAGRLAILSRLPGGYASVLTEALRCGGTLEEAESRVLGTGHARIGAYLLGLWGLPRAIVDAVGHHHDDGVLETDGLVGIVATANLLAHQASAAARSAPLPVPTRSIR